MFKWKNLSQNFPACADMIAPLGKVTSHCTSALVMADGILKYVNRCVTSARLLWCDNSARQDRRAPMDMERGWLAALHETSSCGTRDAKQLEQLI